MGLLFDISPRQVLNSPDLSPHQAYRVKSADVGFPLDFLRFKERLWILDGVHRLARLYQLGESNVRLRVHPSDIIADITVPA